MTSPEQSKTNQELLHTVAAWQEFLAEADMQALLDTAVETEQTDDGDIYVVVPPAEKTGLVGDFAIVDMRKVKVDTPHLHTGGEVEVHFPLQGTAEMSLRETVVGLARGDAQIIQPETPHFIIPDADYIVGVLSVPGYNPENQLPIDTANPPEGFNVDLYFETLAQN